MCINVCSIVKLEIYEFPLPHCRIYIFNSNGNNTVASFGKIYYQKYHLFSFANYRKSGKKSPAHKFYISLIVHAYRLSRDKNPPLPLEILERIASHRLIQKCEAIERYPDRYIGVASTGIAKRVMAILLHPRFGAFTNDHVLDLWRGWRFTRSRESKSYISEHSSILVHISSSQLHFLSFYERNLDRN